VFALAVAVDTTNQMMHADLAGTTRLPSSSRGSFGCCDSWTASTVLSFVNRDSRVEPAAAGLENRETDEPDQRITDMLPGVPDLPIGEVVWLFLLCLKVYYYCIIFSPSDVLNG